MERILTFERKGLRQYCRQQYRGRHEKVMHLPLDHGADVNAKGKCGTAVELASSLAQEKIVYTSFDEGANVMLN